MTTQDNKTKTYVAQDLGGKYYYEIDATNLDNALAKAKRYVREDFGQAYDLVQVFAMDNPDCEYCIVKIVL